MGDVEVAGKPVEVFIVLRVGDKDNPEPKVDAVFSGYNRLGLAQRHQREHGGFIVKALDWEQDDD